jgi:hypothetical protein
MSDIMNKEMQVKLIKDMLNREGVSPDTVDVEAEIDPSLSYPENELKIKNAYVPIKYDTMQTSSPEMEEIQSLKSQAVRREEVEKLIDRKLNKLMELRSQVKMTNVNPTQQPQKQEAMRKVEEEIIKTRTLKSSLQSRLSGLKGIGYRKIVQPYMARKEAERQLKQAQKQEMLSAIQKGRKMGYYYEGVSLGRQQAKGTFKPNPNIILQQEMAKRYARKKMDIMIRNEINRQIKQQEMMQRQQPMQPQQMMPQQPQYYQPQQKVRKGRQLMQPQVMIPPHNHVPNPLTGKCMICGYKQFRIL